MICYCLSSSEILVIDMCWYDGNIRLISFKRILKVHWYYTESFLGKASATIRQIKSKLSCQSLLPDLTEHLEFDRELMELFKNTVGYGWFLWINFTLIFQTKSSFYVTGRETSCMFPRKYKHTNSKNFQNLLKNTYIFWINTLLLNIKLK